MKLLSAVALAALSCAAYAAPKTATTGKSAKVSIGNRHQVIFGNSFLTAGSFDRSSVTVDASSSEKSYIIGSGDLSLNYAFKVHPKYQVGALVGYSSSSEDIKFNDGSSYTESTTDIKYYGFLTYNFSEVLHSSTYLTLLLGQETSTSETKDSSAGTTKSDLELTVAGLMLGKRFSLRGLGIVNLTYSPSVNFKRELAGGDYEKDGKKHFDTITFDIIKFDLLF